MVTSIGICAERVRTPINLVNQHGISEMDERKSHRLALAAGGDSPCFLWVVGDRQGLQPILDASELFSGPALEGFIVHRQFLSLTPHSTAVNGACCVG